MYAREGSVGIDISMDISMGIHGKSVDMDMGGKFHIHGKPGYNSAAAKDNCALFAPPFHHAC